MQTIHKYPFGVTDQLTRELPANAQVLAVQLQHGTPCLWVLLDPDAPMMPRTFCLYGTGQQIHREPGRYIGTFQLSEGDLVFHLFERDAPGFRSTELLSG